MPLSDSDSSGAQTEPGTRGIEPAGLGALLRQARERRGLTLAQVANETKIPQRHLEALERDNLAAIPHGIYRRAEIRAYARAVHLDQDLALARLERALQPAPAPEAVSGGSKRDTAAPARRPVWGVVGTMVALVAIGVAGIVVGTALWRAMGGGTEPGLDRDAQPREAVDAVTRPVPRVPGTAPDAQADVPDGAPIGSTAPNATRGSALPPGTDRVNGREGETPAADSPTVLVVRTDPPGTRVTVDGIGWGETPVTLRYLTPGRKRVRLSKVGYVTVERLVQVTEGRRITLDVPLRPLP
jgi:cytoskeleton protein RodZ